MSLTVFSGRCCIYKGASFSSSSMDSDIVEDYIVIKVLRSSSYSMLSLIALFNKAFMISSMGSEDRLMQITDTSDVITRMLARLDTLAYVID